MKRLLVLVAAAAIALGLMASPAGAYSTGFVNDAGCTDGMIVQDAHLYSEQLAPTWSLLDIAASYEAPGCVIESLSWDQIAIAVSYDRVAYGGMLHCANAFDVDYEQVVVSMDSNNAQEQSPPCTGTWPAGFHRLTVWVLSPTHAYANTFAF